MFLLSLALGSQPTLTHPDALFGRPVEERVLRGWTAPCDPEGLARHGHPVVDPAAPPAWVLAEGISGPDLERATDQLRTLVTDWLGALEEAGDGTFAKRTFCVGLWDDTAGPNSFAAGGRWLYVGLRDLKTMSTVHRVGQPAVEYTVGHELGHLLQQLAGLDFPGPTARAGELHADCLAGYLMGLGRDPTFTRISGFVAQTEAFRIGDHHLSSPQHHGTPNERRDAFQRGRQAGLAAASAQASASRSEGLLAACTALVR